MITALSVITAGFLLGIAHATDPDHVIAVTTIVNREGNLRRAALIGLAWGLGHTLTIFLVGSSVILLGVVIPGQIELSMELAVSLMLIILGAANLRNFYRRKTLESVSLPPPCEPGISDSGQGGGKPSHAWVRARIHSHHHRHGDYIHNHPHKHRHQEDGQGSHIHHNHQGRDAEAHGHREDETPLAKLDDRLGQLRSYQHLRPLVVGVVHGLAGSAAVALLILTTIPDATWGIAYLLVFGAGTLTGMTLFTLSITSASIFLQRRYQGFSHWMGVSSGLLSVSFGILMAWQLLG